VNVGGAAAKRDSAAGNNGSLLSANLIVVGSNWANQGARASRNAGVLKVLASPFIPTGRRHFLDVSTHLLPLEQHVQHKCHTDVRNDIIL
jgi:hypothetical protein